MLLLKILFCVNEVDAVEQSGHLLVQFLQMRRLSDRVGNLEHFGKVPLDVDQHLLQVNEKVAVHQAPLLQHGHRRDAPLVVCPANADQVHACAF